MNNLRALRKQKGIRQVDIAHSLNLSPQVYCNYENGLREPDFDTLIKIANYFNVTLDYLFGRDSVPDHPIYPNLSPELLDLLDALTPEQQEKVIVFIKGMLA